MTPREIEGWRSGASAVSNRHPYFLHLHKKEVKTSRCQRVLSYWSQSLHFLSQSLNNEQATALYHDLFAPVHGTI